MDRSASNTATGNFKFAVVTPPVLSPVYGNSRDINYWNRPRHSSPFRISPSFFLFLHPSYIFCPSISSSLSACFSLLCSVSSSLLVSSSFRPRFVLVPPWRLVWYPVRTSRGCRSSRSRFLVRRKSLGRSSPRSRQKLRHLIFNRTAVLSPVDRDENKRDQ